MSKSQTLQLCCAWEHLPVLWKAMGVSAAEDEAIAATADPAEKKRLGGLAFVFQHVLTHDLQQIASSYSMKYIRPIAAADRKRLNRLLAIRESGSKLWQQLDPSVHCAVEFSGFLRANQDVQKKELIPVFEDNRDTFKDDLEDRLTNHSLDIEFLLNERGRSRIERKFIIEPFLELLEKHEIRPSRKFPLTAMLKALYLVFGIKNPPSDIMVRQIVSDLKKKASRQKRPEG
jgi:hypothetical protein